MTMNSTLGLVDRSINERREQYVRDADSYV
jgi:hypothetical protein